MRELGQTTTGTETELHHIVQQLEAALTGIDRLELTVIGAQLSQVIDDMKTLTDPCLDMSSSS